MGPVTMIWRWKLNHSLYSLTQTPNFDNRSNTFANTILVRHCMPISKVAQSKTSKTGTGWRNLIYGKGKDDLKKFKVNS